MNHQARTLSPSRLTRGPLGLLLLLVFTLPFHSCGDDAKEDSSLGSLTLNVTPATAEVTMAGPKSYSKTFTGTQLISDLEPGEYTASATASGFSDADAQFNIVAGQTSDLTLSLIDTTTASAEV